jgi:hypothetical protein
MVERQLPKLQFLKTFNMEIRKEGSTSIAALSTSLDAED